MRTPAKHLAALAVVLAACGGKDETCGFRDHNYNATFILLSGPCRVEPPRVLSFDFPPPGCTQSFAYHDCDPTIARVCDGGSVRGLIALRFNESGYSGQIQETYASEVPPVVCRYSTELTEL